MVQIVVVAAVVSNVSGGNDGAPYHEDDDLAHQ